MIMESLPPIQYIRKNVSGLAATTSSTGLLANELSPMAVPRAAEARAIATSPFWHPDYDPEHSVLVPRFSTAPDFSRAVEMLTEISRHEKAG
ncbi:hypothetical protein AB0C52_09855 [Streptomyces sp. NPDC048717]|uniref:hypothetical protein n=1 Tax=Streptomyces sp. NPDC048717 TaxID=3154928 RepID=UPI003432954B